MSALARLARYRAPELVLHETAGADTLGFARVYIFLIWFGYVATLDLQPLASLSLDLYQARGVMTLVPDVVITAITTRSGLLTLKLLCLVLVGLVVVGLCGRNVGLGIATIVLTFLLGITKGFGGHVDHRELVLLYVSAALVILPCFDAYALRPRGDNVPRKQGVYRASMLTLAGVVLMSYLLVGVARVAMGFPEVFHPDVIRGWLLERSLRPNPVGSQAGLWVLNIRNLEIAVAAALPIGTGLEVGCSVILWCGTRVRATVIVGLLAMHVGILVFMNIIFVESMLLLLLLTDYGRILRRMEAFRSGRQLEMRKEGVVG